MRHGLIGKLVLFLVGGGGGDLDYLILPFIEVVR